VRETEGNNGDTEVPCSTFDERAEGTTTRGLLVTSAQNALLRRATACCEHLLTLLYEGALGGRQQIVHGDLHMANVMQVAGGCT
jgi:predicted trehalose synthase